MTRPKPWRNQPPSTITLAGIPVAREHVQWLAENIDEPTSTRLHRALSYETRLLGLEINEREQIFRALDDPPAGLEELRGVSSPDTQGASATGSYSARVVCKHVSSPRAPGKL